VATGTFFVQIADLAQSLAFCSEIRKIHLSIGGKEKLVATFTDEKAEHKAALEKIKSGLATKVRILANRDGCPACRAVEGVYDFDDVPELPVEGCSHGDGCRCHYAPVLDYFGP
jgi:hypothetical protein